MMDADLKNMSREELLALAKQLKGKDDDLRGTGSGKDTITQFKERGRTTVIIDDSKLMHRRYQSIIEPMGFKVVATAENGAFGADLVLTYKPALVLLDYQMPVMDGEQTAKEIRKQDKEVKIIVISGALNKHIAQGLLRVGINDILVKPIDVQKFKDALAHIGFKESDSR